MSDEKRRELHEVSLPVRRIHKDGLAPELAARPFSDARRERAMAVKAIFRRDRDLEHPFGEIVALAETAGAQVVETVAQNLERIHARTYLGKGKVEEAAARAKELDVDLVIADNDLSPAQERNLEKSFERKVIDRSQLILDIFARRASTVQAKLQVELAQLKYTLPRLKRMWTHLERFEGGIGMRGPGETQLETDKRLIQRRIRMLQAKLDDIERRRQVTLLKQPDEFILALVGYTNAGKSTLLNRLTGSEELVEDKLFATLDTRTRRWRVDGKRHVLLKDTVGFIRQLPHHLVASFHATLAETQSADVLLHVVDASSSEAERHIAAVEGVLRRIDCDDKPTWLVLNKWDRVPADRRAEALRLETHARVGGPVFAVSAVDGSGLDAVRQAVVEQIEARQQRVSVLLPHGRGDLFAFCQRHGKVLAQELREDGIRLELELGPAGAAKLRSLYPEGFAEPSEAQHEPGPDDEKKGEA